MVSGKGRIYQEDNIRALKDFDGGSRRKINSKRNKNDLRITVVLGKSKECPEICQYFILLGLQYMYRCGITHSTIIQLQLHSRHWLLLSYVTGVEVELQTWRPAEPLVQEGGGTGI